jgi:hypothetical protein
MRIFHAVSVSAAAFLASLALAGDARAIPLPDSSSCNSGICLNITNTDASSTGTAIRGRAEMAGGTGVWGESTTSSTTFPGYGVFGRSTGNGHGVKGTTSGTGHGVVGEAINASFAGVHGIHGSGNGVFGLSYSPVASGVYALNSSQGGYGVAGRVSFTGTGTAVYGNAGNSSTAWAGYFAGRVSAASYLTNSDARLKKDIQTLPYGIEELNRLRPVTYRWKDEQRRHDKQLGLIAQEVQAVIPELVDSDARQGMLSVNYQGLVPVMIKVLQDQQKIINRQEARIAALEKGKSPALSLLMGGNAATWALGLVPLGLVAGWRRRRERERQPAA